MFYTCKPKKMAIYVNTKWLTIDQVKAETGCDVIINGGLFNPDWTACCHLKAGGKVYAADQWKYFGFGWHEGKADLRLTSEYSDLDYYICCVCLIYQGKAQDLLYPAEMGGLRPRTFIGTYPDGRVIFYASSDRHTPEGLRSLCQQMGLYGAIMLDGGGSTQGICPVAAYRQSRKVHNFICAWLEDDAVTPADPCPYKEPTVLISRWSYTREGAKWVQWHLNANGYKPALAVDGIIGGKTHAAIMAFQTDHGLKADGIVGNLTRARLKAFHPPDEAEPDDGAPLTEADIIKPNYRWNGTLLKRAGTNYIILHHAAATCTAEDTHVYHRDSKGWIGIGYNFFVDKQGRIYEGRPIDKVGAHCVSYNNQSVGVCFSGNFETEQMNEAQIVAGRKLVKYLKTYYPNAAVKQHKDLAATACAGRYFPFNEIAGGG